MQQKQFYWSPRSAQHVSGKLLPIFRSARLKFFTTYGTISCDVVCRGFRACCLALRLRLLRNLRNVSQNTQFHISEDFDVHFNNILREATISFVMSVCPHDSSQLLPYGLPWNLYLNIFFPKSDDKTHILFKYDKNNEYFVWRLMYICDN
jgi:hypothetical protein